MWEEEREEEEEEREEEEEEEEREEEEEEREEVGQRAMPTTCFPAWSQPQGTEKVLNLLSAIPLIVAMLCSPYEPLQVPRNYFWTRTIYSFRRSHGVPTFQRVNCVRWLS